MGDQRGMLVSGNWKMHENHFETLKFAQELAALLRVSGVPAGREVSDPGAAGGAPQVASWESDSLRAAVISDSGLGMIAVLD